MNDEKIIEFLEKSLIHFKDSRFDLNSCAVIVKHIVNLIRTGIMSNRIDSNGLFKMIQALQESIGIEFSKKGPYEKKVFEKLQENFEKCLFDYSKETMEMFHIRYESLEKRMNLYQNVEDLTRLVLREPKSPGKREEEKKRRLIGLSYAYASLINSVFRYSLQDCYAWERLSTGKKIAIKDIERKEVNDIYNHYKQVNDLLYFEGYDITIKNSVERSNFYYELTNEKITFVDEYYALSDQTGKSEIMNNSTIQSLEEIAEKYEKIETVYKLVILFNQILIINSMCKVLSDRYH